MLVLKMVLLRNFCLQLYIAAMAVCVVSSCAKLLAQTREPIRLDMWMPVSSYGLVIDGDLRTIYATNKIDDLKLYLDFSSPVINSTSHILSALRVNSGLFVPIPKRSRNNRRFAFKLKDILSTEIVKVELEAASVFGRKGSHVSDVSPFTFLYDTTEPGVTLSTSSSRVLEDPNIHIVIEFTKPVFEFEASNAEVKGGYITRFEEISRALYSLTVEAESEDITVSVLKGKAKDISGNQNSASNVLHIKHYSSPSLSVGLHSFMTVGILAASLAATVISISSANLEAMATQHSVETSFSNPSMNLQGLFGHLQTFVLANWISDPLPFEYLETTKGLRWLIPREKLPWKIKNSSMSQSPTHLMKFTRMLLRKQVHLTNLTMRNTRYGQPLDLSEYFTYFLRGEPLSASTVVNKMEIYTGWKDLEMNLFWLGVGVISLLTIHFLTLLFLRWRARKPFHGVLSLPRFELFLLILVLPCISQSSAFVIRGGTSAGILMGILLLIIPAGTILSVSLFLVIAIFPGSFVQYREVILKTDNGTLSKRILFLFTGKPNKGKWISKQGLPLSFLPRFGVLFETRKGPPLFVSEEEIKTGVSSDYSYEENDKVPMLTRLLGYAKSFYIVLDLVRRVSFGIISGAFPLGGFSQTLFALLITLVQFLYLIALKPYISTCTNVVEGVSLLCEAVLFTLAISVNEPNLVKKSGIGFVMVGLLFVTYVSQIANVWYGIIKLLLKFSHPHKNSLKTGLKNAAKGLILPLLSRSRREREGMNRERERSAMSATVVPVLSPGLSPQQHNNITQERELKSTKAESMKNEMKKLRQLAKASFAGVSNYEEGSTSYAI